MASGSHLIATPLKDLYGPEIPDRIAKAIVEVHPSFVNGVPIRLGSFVIE